MTAHISGFIAQLQALDIQLRLEGERLRLNGPEEVLTDALIAEIQARKADITGFLSRLDTGDGPTPTTIPRVSREGRLPVSFSQERLWFLHQWDAGSMAAYHIPTLLRARGPLDAAGLEISLTLLVARHETLRTGIGESGGVPFQQIAAHLAVSLPVIDLSGLKSQDREAERGKLWSRDFGAPFTLERPPLFRSRLLRFSAEHHDLQLVLHHLITDGWSADIFIREWTTLYQLYLRQSRPALEPIQESEVLLHWQASTGRAEPPPGAPLFSGEAHPKQVRRFLSAVTGRWQVRPTEAGLTAFPSLTAFTHYLNQLRSIGCPSGSIEPLRGEETGVL